MTLFIASAASQISFVSWSGVNHAPLHRCPARCAASLLATALASTWGGRCRWPSATCAARRRAMRSCASTVCRWGAWGGHAACAWVGMGEHAGHRAVGGGISLQLQLRPCGQEGHPHTACLHSFILCPLSPRRRWRALCSAARRMRGPSWARSCPPASSSCGARCRHFAAVLFLV